MNQVYEEMALNIIEKQESIIGPVAIERAKQVSGFKVDWDGKKEVHILSDPLKSLNQLVAMYKELFGQLSVEVCKEAVGRQVQQLSPDEMPEALR